MGKQIMGRQKKNLAGKPRPVPISSTLPYESFLWLENVEFLKEYSIANIIRLMTAYALEDRKSFEDFCNDKTRNPLKKGV